MICEECGVNPATIRLVTVVNGERRERNLCAACMGKMKKQFSAIDLSSLAGLLGGILEAAKKQNAEESAQEKIEATCPDCGQTYEAFQKTGFLGCAGCYKAFREPLEALLKRVHGHTQHTGRVPGGLKSGVALKLNIDRLRQQLGRAIAEEEYEQAARLRDEIRSLKKELEKLEAPVAVSIPKEEASHD